LKARRLPPGLHFSSHANSPPAGTPPI
jgi:hypothetical protein